MLSNILFLFWLFVLLLLLLYVIEELYLLFMALRSKRVEIIQQKHISLPKVTLQLPLYNERFVVIRLLEHVLTIDYPKELIQIQILDDSTDETSQLIQEFIQSNQLDTTIWQHIQRKERTGYKAGALQYGLEIAQGEFIAIFDADFMPQKNFLLQTIPFFQNEEIGVIQTRWSFVNKSYSLLTRAQAIMLDTHFSIEQLGRSKAKAFINFNGTAGIWRKECILDAGGWQDDTLTEDLDLSFRAQANGWKFQYLFDVHSPSELPITFDAFRTQQFRWSKGAAECFKKNAKNLWRTKLSLKVKLIGSFHLLNSSVYLLTILLLLLTPLIEFLRVNNHVTVPFHEIFSLVGLVTTLLLILLFFSGSLFANGLKWKSILWFPPSILTFFAMTTGIAPYMALGVLEGYRGKKSPFIRTPKFGDKSKASKRVKKGYDFKKEFSLKTLEFIFLIYGLYMIYLGALNFNVIVITYGGILSCGFILSLFLKKTSFR